MLVGIRTSNTKKRLELVMKRQIRQVVWFVALLVLLSTSHVASAYYDPGVQRWINRDPIGERGGLNLYCFVGNAPTGKIDPRGRYGKKGGPDSQEVKDDVCACGLKNAYRGFQLAKMAQGEAADRYPTTPWNGGPQDAFRHCYWNCLMSRELGYECANAIGRNHEADGDRQVTNGPGDHEMDDYNNFVGATLGEGEGDCGNLCEMAVENGTLQVNNPTRPEPMP